MIKDRMMIYCWEEPAYPGELKIGEHFTRQMSLDDAKNHTAIYRIRNSLGVRKDLFDREKLNIHFIIDLSDHARSVQKFYSSASYDNIIHQTLTGRHSNGSEVFSTTLEHVKTQITNLIGRNPFDDKIIKIKIKNNQKIQTLIKTVDRSEGILSEADSPNLWKSHIDSIIEKIYNNKKVSILNIGSGYGTEADILIDGLRNKNWTDEKIKKSLIINDKDIKYVKDYEDLGFKCDVGDFLRLEYDNMKQDVILCNPPYNGKLYEKIVNKAAKLLKEDGVGVFIIPSTWLKTKKRAEIFNSKRISSIRLFSLEEQQKYFNIGTNICIITLTGKKVEKTKIYSVESGFETEVDSDLNFFRGLPHDLNEISFSIHQKIILKDMLSFDISKAPRKFVNDDELLRNDDIKDDSDSQYQYPHFTSKSKIRWARFKQPEYDLIKVGIYSQDAVDKAFIIQESNTGNDIHFIAVSDIGEANNLKNICNSSLFKYLDTMYGGNTKTRFRQTKKILPVLEYSRSWNDKDIFENFELTPIEIAYIENIARK